MSIDQQDDFEGMKRIGTIVANCLALLKAATRPGMTTEELDEMAGRYLENQGAISAPKSVYKFPGFVCLSLEKSAAHGIPDGTKIQEGDLLNIDVSAHKDGFYADNGESIVVGQGAPEKQFLCKAVNQALDVALRSARAGAPIASMGKKVEKMARNYGLTVIQNLGGHGIGRSLHEAPEFIPSFHDRRDKRVFSNNQVVAIEPFLSNGATWIEQADDGWTLFHPKYYTAQREHTVMITKNQPFIFTKPDRTFD
jgi:methionyl aminopeptidase